MSGRSPTKKKRNYAKKKSSTSVLNSKAIQKDNSAIGIVIKEVELEEDKLANVENKKSQPKTPAKNDSNGSNENVNKRKTDGNTPNDGKPKKRSSIMEDQDLKYDKVEFAPLSPTPAKKQTASQKVEENKQDSTPIPENTPKQRKKAQAEVKPIPTPLLSSRIPSTVHCPAPCYCCTPIRIRNHFSFPAIPPQAADDRRIFTPPTPTATPSSLFTISLNNHPIEPSFRFTHKTTRTQILIFTSAHLTTPTSTHSYTLALTPTAWSPPFHLALEQDGTPHTLDRAELRAVHAAITLREWHLEGIHTVVIATSSKYVLDGMTQLPKWIAKGGKQRKSQKGKAGKGEVRNWDLWRAVAGRLRALEGEGVLVRVWLVERGVNEAAAMNGGEMKGDECKATTEIVWMERAGLKMEEVYGR